MSDAKTDGLPSAIRAQRMMQLFVHVGTNITKKEIANPQGLFLLDETGGFKFQNSCAFSQIQHCIMPSVS